jgi:hypothetical protein
MAKTTRNSSVLNQFGSPSLNSNSFANRPTFGQVGRLFVDTTNNIIQRDTGSSWVTINGGGGSQNLQSVTTIGNTTTVGIFAGASGSLTAGRLLEINGKTKLTDTSGNVLYIGNPSVTPNSSTLDVYGYTVLRNTVDSTTNLGPILYSQYTINYNGTALSGFANSIFTQDIYNVSANTNVAFSTQSGTSLNVNTYKFSTASTITMQQAGGTIRAASALTSYAQFQNAAAGTITHTAGIAILGIENLGGSSLSITNNYQLLINASDEFASTAIVTNRWGIYQGGENDVNYFAGKTLINRNTDDGSISKLQVNGDVSINGTIISGNILSAFGGIGHKDLISGYLGYALYYGNNGENTLNFVGNGFFKFTKDLSTNIGKFTNSGNFIIGSSTDTTRKLLVEGEQEWKNITYATGVHTTSGNHLPIWVNGTKYWLALLNPPV